MDQLLRRVLQYAVRTCKAGSGAIYLLDKRGNTSMRAPPVILDPYAEPARSQPAPSPCINS